MTATGNKKQAPSAEKTTGKNRRSADKKALKSESATASAGAQNSAASGQPGADTKNVIPPEYNFSGPDEASVISYTPDEDRKACERFAEHFHRLGARMCFLLDYIPSDAMAGLELSVFRRIGFFQEYLKADNILLLTRNYQSRATENALRQIDLERFSSVSILNLYDYIQGINRAVFPDPLPEPPLNPAWDARPAPAEPRDTMVYDANNHCVMYIHRYPTMEGVDYINYLNHGKIYRRDTFDIQGFLSRTEYIDPGCGVARHEVFYRPDHTVAMTVTNRRSGKDGKMAEPIAIELMDRRGRVLQHFDSHDSLVGWWLVQLTRNSRIFDLIIADEVNHYQTSFKELQKHRKECNNLRVITVAHSGHLMDPTDPTSKIGDNYHYIHDQDMRVDMLVTLTGWQKHDIATRYGKDNRNITVIPHPLTGPAPTAPQPRKSLLPPHSIILVARLDPLKRHEHAMQAFSEVIKEVPDATLHFYGHGPAEKDLKKYADEHGLKDKVIFHGFVNDMEPVYDSAEVLISCSRVEGFGLTIIEALIRGCPAVSYNVRYGPQAMIIDGENGYLTPNADPHAMAQRLIEILKDPALRERLAQGAVKSIARFEQSVIAARWARLLDSLLPGKTVSKTKTAKTRSN